MVVPKGSMQTAEQLQGVAADSCFVEQLSWRHSYRHVRCVPRGLVAKGEWPTALCSEALPLLLLLAVVQTAVAASHTFVLPKQTVERIVDLYSSDALLTWTWQQRQ